MHSFAALMPLPLATSAFRLGRSYYSSLKPAPSPYHQHQYNSEQQIVVDSVETDNDNKDALTHRTQLTQSVWAADLVPISLPSCGSNMSRSDCSQAATSTDLQQDDTGC